jgi:uncharacterized protein YecE (DUF72 family)
MGGRQYFSIPRVNSLENHPQAFRFIEVNSALYTLPDYDFVRSRRRKAPESFEFLVKTNRVITYAEELSPGQKALKYLEKFLRNLLNTQISKLISLKGFSRKVY